MEKCCECKMCSWFGRLRMKNIKCLINTWSIDYILKWYFNILDWIEYKNWFHLLLFINVCVCVCVCVCVVAQLCPALCDTIDCSPISSSVHEILQQESWRGLPCPLQGIFPNWRLNPGLLHWKQNSHGCKIF